MAFDRLTFSKNWKSASDFPTLETDETKVREDMQLLHDETMRALNALMDALEQGGKDTLIRRGSDTASYLRRTETGVLETSSDGVTWYPIARGETVENHASQHKVGGSDPITPASIGAASAGHSHSAADVGAAAAEHTHTPSAIGAAPASHGHGEYAPTAHAHSASDVTEGVLSLARGGTSITTNPSMRVNLASEAAADLFATSPRPGVTGVLPVKNGGTGRNNLADLATELATVGLAKMRFGVYTGTAPWWTEEMDNVWTAQTISLGATPKAVLVFQNGTQTYTSGTSSSATVGGLIIAGYPLGGTEGDCLGEIVDGGFIVRGKWVRNNLGDDAYGDPSYSYSTASMNTVNTQYRYIAWL